MVDKDSGQRSHDATKSAVEVAIRIGVIALLCLWVYDVVSPFIGPIMWGAIIAVAGYSPYQWLVKRCGGRKVLAASVFTIIALVVLVAPLGWLTEAVVAWLQELASELGDGKLEIPPAPESVKEWPIIGERVFDFWTLTSANLEDAVHRFEDQLKSFGIWLVKSAAGAALGVLHFVLSIVIAGVLLVNAEPAARFVNAFASRLAPVSGARFSLLAEQTVRGVATGVVGVAVIQCLLAAIGFVAVDVPGAPMIALACLFIGIIQLPLSIPIVPVIVYVWLKEPTSTAVLFTLWSVPVMVLDNFLKPILMGRGVEAPMLVVFIGAIGGMVTNGVIGLFTGAVVLVLAYELFRAWLEDKDEPHN